MENPNTVHGRLNEAMHIAGYAFERAWQKFEWLLEEERWKQVGDGHEDINTFLSTVQLPKGATPEQRKAVAEKIKELEPQASQRKIAGTLGVSHETISKDLRPVKQLTLEPEKPNRDTAKPNATVNELTPEPAGDVVAAEAKRKAEVTAKRDAKERERKDRRQENADKVAGVEPAEVINAGVKFATIVIDPPWDWNDEGDVNQLGRARPDYTSMSIEEIAALPVGELADTDCHIYLWITNRSLPKGFDLLRAWGFRYITAITWVKPSFGMGNYFRGQTEHALFGVKGSQMLKRKDAPTVFNAPRGPGGHSSKPPEFLAFVESCSPGPYVEMFSRSERDGWTGWGENA